ncbi:hypothetical protein ACF8O8_21405 [Pseudomonas sp. TYF_14]|uniref:hypothetical protein n=1 Tax=Pseudomonas sp. TYF_14 TaxID=3367193 RepID=UPI00370B2921
MLVIFPVIGFRYRQYFPLGYRFGGSVLFLGLRGRGAISNIQHLSQEWVVRADYGALNVYEVHPTADFARQFPLINPFLQLLQARLSAGVAQFPVLANLYKPRQVDGDLSYDFSHG